MLRGQRLYLFVLGHRWFLSWGLIRPWVLLVNACLHQNQPHNPMPAAGFGSRAIRWRRRAVGRGAGMELLPWLVGWGLSITSMCRAGCRSGGWCFRNLLTCQLLLPFQLMRNGSCIPLNLSDQFDCFDAALIEIRYLISLQPLCCFINLLSRQWSTVFWIGF
jgi:hypothetical protein